MTRKLIRFLITLYAVLMFAGTLEADGSFKAARAGAGAIGLALLGMEFYAELIPYRPNRTYYRLVIARVEV